MLEFDGQDTLYGLIVGTEVVLDYFSLRALESVLGPLGVQAVMHDSWFEPCPLSVVRKRIEEEQRRASKEVR